MKQCYFWDILYIFQYDSTILRPPNMDPKKREELLSEMRDLIDTFLVETLEEQARGIIMGEVVAVSRQQATYSDILNMLTTGTVRILTSFFKFPFWNLANFNNFTWKITFYSSGLSPTWFCISQLWTTWHGQFSGQHQINFQVVDRICYKKRSI